MLQSPPPPSAATCWSAQSLPKPVAGAVSPWTETPDGCLGQITNIWAEAEHDGIDVISGQPNADGWDAQMWYSNDGSSWRLATLPAEPHIDRIHAIAATPDGFVALGLVLADEFRTQTLTSSDGRSWQVAGSYAGLGRDLAQINGRLIAFNNDSNSPSDPMYSDDGGTTWKAVDTESGLEVGDSQVGLLETDGFLWAVRSDDPIEDASIKTPVELWRTADGLNWEQVVELPNSISVNGAVIAVGPIGWVIAARRATFTDYEQSNEWFAWRSADGLAWQAASKAPEYIGQIVADGQGFIGIGRDPGSCCALEESNVRQHIWTSSDGSMWHQQSQKGWHGREIDFITDLGDKVVGVGMDWLLGPPSRNFAWGVTWEADRADLLR